jgi:hypothetical protein
MAPDERFADAHRVEDRLEEFTSVGPKTVGVGGDPQPSEWVDIVEPDPRVHLAAGCGIRSRVWFGWLWFTEFAFEPRDRYVDRPSEGVGVFVPCLVQELLWGE